MAGWLILDFMCEAWNRASLNRNSLIICEKYLDQGWTIMSIWSDMRHMRVIH